MKKSSSIIILCVIAIIFVLLVLITVPLNGKDKVQVGKSDTDFTWIINAVDLGIDLKGGFYAEYECYFDDGRNVTDEDIAGAISNLQDILYDKGYPEAVVETVTKSGNKYIRVEVAGLKDTESLMALIGQSSTLTFRNEDGDIVMTGTGNIKTCSITLDENNSSYYALALQFNNAGAKRFAEITEEYNGKALSIYIDETKVMSPKVNSVISDGRASITGQFTYEQAYEYQVKIQAGISETKLRLTNSDTVSASLGAEALKYSLIAAGIGIGIIIILMILIYRGLGLAASCALLIYTELLIILLALVPWVELTISGIAGVILSIGMAVDANVIIFERIKEVRNGSLAKGIKTCVKDGFSSAFITILDANITTIIGTIVMIIFGSSSVKSFAITLLIGILLSMFSAILVTRLFINCFIPFNEDNFGFFCLAKDGLDSSEKKAVKALSTEEV